ncbi:MAG: SpoIIE family protein phosphatase [Bacteroidales bacterium]|nr:SpoIIE family protein phosphatase [Bacteroidales bacterium]
MPKDVVSGDFYFISEFHNKVLFAAVDCTGHGVPGALMSVIGFNSLTQAVRKTKIDTPGKVLSFLDESVNEILRQTDDESGVKDSMDLAVCTIDFEKKELMYAGAYNPLYYVHKGELHEIKADKLPIGVNVDGVVDIFTDHTIQLETGDAVYIFSDGYADQFGGPKNKKFMYKQLREVIMSVQDKPIKEQGEILERTLTEWQGDEDQIDDILVMGVKI